MNRADKHVIQLAENFAFAYQVRAIEAVHQAIHDDLLQWGRWGQEQFPGCPPEHERPSIWDMPGEGDPDRDMEAVPEPIDPPINEKRAIELDAKINDLSAFPTLWARVLYVNYVWRPVEWVRPEVVIRRGISTDNYLRNLHAAMDYLA